MGEKGCVGVKSGVGVYWGAWGANGVFCGVCG